MHILFLSHYFPPEVNAPAARSSEHCRQWAADGDDVTVVTCAPNHPIGKLYPGFLNRPYQRSRWEGVNVVRVLTYVTPNEGVLKRTANYLVYMLAATFASVFVRRVDIVVSTSPQFFNGVAGYFVSAMLGVPWLLEIRDLWPESILELGAIKNRWLIRLLHAMARFGYRKADHIVVVTDAFKRHIVQLGVDPDRITVIKNGVDLTLFKPKECDHDFRASIGMNGKFVASYVGTHGLAHGLETIIEAASMLRGHDHIGFLLVGDGAERKRILAMRDALGLTNVVMLDQQSRDAMPKVWSATDVSLVILRDKPVFATVIPSKMFETMAMRRPIILGVAGESRQIVEQAGAGFCIPPENARSLADAILAISGDRVLAEKFGACGYAYVTLNHDRINLARQFAMLLRKMTSAHKSIPLLANANGASLNEP